MSHIIITSRIHNFRVPVKPLPRIVMAHMKLRLNIYLCALNALLEIY